MGGLWTLTEPEGLVAILQLVPPFPATGDPKQKRLLTQNLKQNMYSFTISNIVPSL